MTTPYEMGTVEATGILMPYAKAGTGSKTLIILPGLSIKPVTPMIAAVAAQYQAFLDNDYTIYVFDRRTNAPAGYSVQLMAKDTAACMEKLGISKADVAGTSQGGMIALCLASGSPHLVDHLLLGSTCARAPKSLQSAIKGWISLAERKQEDALIESFGGLCSQSRSGSAQKRPSALPMPTSLTGSLPNSY